MKTPRRSRLLVLVAVMLLAAVGAVAYAATQQGPAIETTIPQTAEQMTNIDVLRQQIKNYYGVPFATTGSGATAGWTLPLNQDSNYARETRGVAAVADNWLSAKAPKTAAVKKAIVLDVDDTTLATFNYELYSNWDYNPTTNAIFVNGGLFPAVPGMPDMVNAARTEGYAVVFITGRPDTQHAATLANLASTGYGTPTPVGSGDGLFTKPAIADYPAYLQTACADELSQSPPKSCTTIHYKSATRAYIESLGYDIVGNFGDQFSDLIGGYADRTFKLPNPSYYLP